MNKEVIIDIENPKDNDLISRQAVMDALCNGCELYKNREQTCFSRCEEYHFLATLPSVKPQEPKTGQWIEEDMFDGDVAYRCSECNELFWIESGTPKDNGYNFCPKCGKRLFEPQEGRDKE